MTAGFRSYQDLDVWKKGLAIAKFMYQATANFPVDERFGLTNQMRRAAVSIPSNIAEGHARLSTAEFQRFISIAMGSIAELETQILLSADLGFLTEAISQEALRQLDEIGKMARGLHRSLANRRGEEGKQ
jgi:four helix bundle protein